MGAWISVYPSWISMLSTAAFAVATAPDDVFSAARASSSDWREMALFSHSGVSRATSRRALSSAASAWTRLPLACARLACSVLGSIV